MHILWFYVYLVLLEIKAINDDDDDDCVGREFRYLRNKGGSLWNIVPNSELGKLRNCTSTITSVVNIGGWLSSVAILLVSFHLCVQHDGRARRAGLSAAPVPINYIGLPYCWADTSAGRVEFCPLVSHVEYAPRALLGLAQKDGRTDRPTDARPIITHTAGPWRGQLNNRELGKRMRPAHHSDIGIL